MDALQIATALIQKWEGCSLTAYPDPATGADPWTIGYGATGPSISQGTAWTQDQADADLISRISTIRDQIDAKSSEDMDSNVLGACISLAYNIGIGAFLGSTLFHLWNIGEVQQAAAQFAQWNRAAGQIMQGLVNRRADEARVFLGGDP